MDIIPAVGVLIAFTQASIALAVFCSSRQQHSSAMKLSSHQQFLDLGTQRIIRIHDWGNDCIDALVQAREFCFLQTSDFPDTGAYAIQKSKLLHRLSSLIDRGRLFYRNTDQDKCGRDKFPARRGYRPEILDPLVAAYRSLTAMSGTSDQVGAERLYRWRGRFISLLQFEVDPNWLQRARYYSAGPGTEAGIPVNTVSEPPEWPEDRGPLPPERSCR